MINAILVPFKKLYQRYDHSLKITLMFWFLILSLVPFIVVAWYGYIHTVQSVDELQRNKLSDTAAINVATLDERFYEASRSLLSWSELYTPRSILQSLSQRYERSNQRLCEFISSNDYLQVIDAQPKTLEKIAHTYDYVYDLFLIDLKGNILYTIKHESDLGTNLLNGSYSKTRFAKAYRTSLADGKAHFSDLEHYRPSNGILTGFITQPMRDESGNMVGIMAIQLHMDLLFGSIKMDDKKMRQYLVGSDGLLRTSIGNESDILNRRISTEAFWDWYKEHGLHGNYSDTMDEVANVYMGPDGKMVLGEHRSINLMGVRWAHISEMDEADMLAVPNHLLTTILIFSLIVGVIVIIAGIVIARRIVKPLALLSHASQQYMNGVKGIQVTLDTDNEVGAFGDVFNALIQKQEYDAQKLEYLAQKAQKTLEELKEQKYALDAHSIVAITDVKGDIIFVNKKFEEISGYDRAELIGKNHRILNSGCHGAAFWKEMYETVSHGNIWHDEVCNIAKDGHHYWVDTTIVPFFGEDGAPKNYIAIRTDITAQKNVQILLAEKEGSLQTLLDSVAEGIYGVDMQGYCTFVNKSFLRILGFDDESKILGKHIHETIHHSHEDGSFYPSSECKMYKANQTHLPSHVDDEVFWRNDGSSIAVEYWSYPIIQEGIYVGAVATFLDISERKIVEKQMIEAKEAAESSARAKSEFLATMSHEIRTPMNGVLGMLGLLSHSQLDETQRHQIRIASNSAKSLLGIINDILDFSKVEAGKMELEMITFNLREELVEFVEAMAFKAKEKGLELILDVTQLTRTVVRTDPGRLRQILINLIGNAVKFTHKGTILVKVRVDEVDEYNGRLRIDVSDSGIGIAADKIDALFQPFIQADNSTTRKYGGTGLGLAIVKKLCELMDGSISITSIENEGSTFHVNIGVGLEDVISLSQCVLVECPNNNDKQTGPEESTDMQWPSDTRLLLVEDNPTNQIVAQGMLELIGLETDIANNGLEAIESMQLALETMPYTLILMDCQMPEMDGYEASMAIRDGKAGDAYKNIPIVAMTANAMAGDREKCLISGMSDYLSKPINLDTLKATLIKWLNGIVTEVPYISAHKQHVTFSKEEGQELKVWDEADALRRLGGKKELLLKIMHSFIDESEVMTSAMGKAIKHDDLATIQLHAHSIKGSAGNVSAQQLQALAKMMEFAAKNGDKSVLKEGYINLQKAMQEVCDKFREVLSKEEKPVIRKKRLDPLQMAVKLQNLKKEVESGSFIDTDVMDVFSEYADEEFTARIHLLKGHIDRFEASEALILLDIIMAGLE